MYLLLIVILLMSECAIYGTLLIWPNCLSLEVDPQDLTRSLQHNYGNIGEEQFTAAVDLAQTMFSCCGVESANEYDTSLWRLQSLGPSLAVPLTCCKLKNYDVPKAYLNPQPINSTLCQALESNRHEGYRHVQGCSEFLQQWYRLHYLIFLGIGLIAVLSEFAVLLSAVFMCTRIYKHGSESRETKSKNIISLEKEFPTAAYSNETYVMTRNHKS